MKNNILSASIFVWVLVLMTLVFPLKVSAALDIYPPPGDLSTIANLKQSGDFTVKVNGRSCFVYESAKY